MLGFVPLFVIWAGLRVDARALRTSYKATLALSLPHLIAVVALAWTPLSWWQHTKLYDRLVFTRETPALAATLKADLPAGATLMARTYNPAAMLAFPYGQYVPVFGVGRHHARQDDQIIDFHRYEGQALRVFDYNEPDLADFQPFFRAGQQEEDRHRRRGLLDGGRHRLQVPALPRPGAGQDRPGVPPDPALAAPAGQPVLRTVRVCGVFAAGTVRTGAAGNCHQATRHRPGYPGALFCSFKDIFGLKLPQKCS